jgi:hypothetical protein
VSQATAFKTASMMKPPKRTLQTQPVPEQIRQRAFEIYVSRNGALGDEVQDWLQAERELSPEQS